MAGTSCLCTVLLVPRITHAHVCARCVPTRLGCGLEEFTARGKIPGVSEGLKGGLYFLVG
jgi:hypothetical protein